MRDEGFQNLYHNEDFHEYIKKYSRKFSGRSHIQEEYEQEAWLAISQAPDSLDAPELKELARKMIRSAYHQQNKNRLLLNAQQKKLPPEWISDSLDIAGHSKVYVQEEMYDGFREDFCNEQAWDVDE